MSQIITLKNGKLTVGPGMDIHFEEAHIQMNGQAAPAEQRASSSGRQSGKSKKGSEEAPTGKRAKNAELYSDIAEFVKKNEGCGTQDIHNAMKEKGHRIDNKKLVNKITIMKAKGELEVVERGKYKLSADYYTDPPRSNFKVND